MRILYLTFGWVFLGLGGIGTVLPLVPTTPFVLLAAFCFARGSQELHRWLHRSRVFGPVLRDWEDGQAISMRAKVTAAVMLGGLVGYQAGWGGWPIWVRVLLVATAVAVLGFVLSRPAPRARA